MQSILKRLAGNTLLFAIGNSVSLILSFIMVPFYTKVLSTSDFGISDIIITTVSMLLPLLSLNIFAAIFRFALDKDENHTQVFSNGLLVSIIGSIISLFTTGLISLLGVKYAFYVGVYLSITLFLNLFQNFTRGMDLVKIYALSGVVSSVINVVSNLVLMAIFHFGLNGYIYSLIISAIITSFYLYFAGNLQKYISKAEISWTKTKELLVYSIPMIPNSFAWWLTNDANKIIILGFLGPSANGLLAVANKLPSMVTTLFSMFTNAWQMTAVDEQGKENTSKIYSITFNLIFGALILGCAIILLIIKPFMHVYVNPNFFSAWKVVPFLLLSSIFSSVSAFFGTTYLVVKKTKGLFTTTLWGMIANVSFCVIFVHFIGLNGAGIAGSLGFLVVSILRFKQTQKYVPLKLSKLFLSSLLLCYLLLTFSLLMNVTIFLNMIIVLIMLAIFGFEILKLKKNN